MYYFLLRIQYRIMFMYFFFAAGARFGEINVYALFFEAGVPFDEIYICFFVAGTTFDEI